MKTLNYFGFFPLMILTAVICGCVQFDNIKTTEKPYVNYTSVELYIGEGAGDRNQIQLTSSPQDKKFTWTSLDPSVASVTQTGLITALSEGFSIITVTSDDDQIDVNVWVREWVPLKGLLMLSEDLIIATRLDKIQIIATPEPLNASEVNIQWTSSDPEAIMVFENGWVLCKNLGLATITAKAGEFEQQVVVQVADVMPKAGWSILGYDATLIENPPWFRTQHVPDGLYLINLIDDNLATYWHSHFYGQGGRAPCYFIIDLGEELLMTHISMYRGATNTNGQDGFELYTCTEDGVDDPENPDTWDWEFQGDFSFDRGTTPPPEQKYALPAYPMVRYVKVFMDARHNPNNFNANFAEIYVYGIY